MSTNKIKVILICHFTNAEMQGLLPLWKHKNEFASWIPNVLKGFENNTEIELHVISPHEYLKRTTELELRNIKFYFIPYGIPFYHRHWPSSLRLDDYINFFLFRRKVRKIVKQINPDIINLIGAENAYYSSAILDYQDHYPVLIAIQGFISEFKSDINILPSLQKRIYFEEKILQSFKYYCGEQDSSSYISNYNPKRTFFRLYFPVNELLALETKYNGKKYDCIYFGRLTKPKGAEDFIKVINEIKKIKPDVSACIIGGGEIKPLITLASNLECINNIEFIGFAKSQKELFEYVKSSRVFLAPPYKDRLSSTIREAMLLKVPIVAYSTGGIPYINEFDENKTKEAKFAQAIDKLDAEIHELDYKKDWKGWTEEFLRKEKEIYFKEFPKIKQAFEKITNYLKENKQPRLKSGYS